MALNLKLKTYIRLDSSGRDIPNTNVLRQKMPVTGRWRELSAYECCYAAVDIVLGVDDFTTDNTIILQCDGDNIAVFTVASTTPTTLQEFVNALNTALSYLGIFSTDGTDVFLKLKLEVAETLCSDTSLIVINTTTV